MDPKPESTAGRKAAGAAGKPGRDERLKAALKANMARRKAQARAKGALGADPEDSAVRDGENKTG